MRYLPELAARAEAYLARPLAEKRSAAGLLELSTVWAAIQGLPTIPACRQCQYSERVHELTAYLRECARFTSSFSVMAEDTQQTSTYQFAPAYAGQTLTDDAYGKVVTADNLTDEDAEHFISKGFGHVFQKIGAAIAGLGEKLEGEGDNLAGDHDDGQPTEREQQLQAKVEQLTEELQDNTDHYNAEYQRVTTELQTSQAALDSEKQAHQATQGQLSEVQQQLSDAQGQVADLQAALTAATAPKAKKASAATTASTDSTASDGSGDASAAQ